MSIVQNNLGDFRMKFTFDFFLKFKNSDLFGNLKNRVYFSGF